MPSLLVVQPDAVQANLLRAALRAHISEGVVILDSLDDALASIDQHVPDVILLPTMMPATEEDYLIAYLATIPGAGHVQVLSLPRLGRPDHHVEPPAPAALFPWRRRQAPRAVPMPACDPGVFTQDVVAYLAGARALKDEIALGRVAALSGGPERRREPRFANEDVPWISLVSFEGERAALINVSSRGALLRTHARPGHHFLKRFDPHVRHRSRLTLELESDHDVHAVGRVIRCVPLNTRAQTRYEIAFSFEDSVGLHLPATALVPGLPRTDDDL